MLDKSPLKTLTLEEFLESERHKLTGTLTPVTPESFAEWKKKRLDKKAAEEQVNHHSSTSRLLPPISNLFMQARKAKEATGRALFESGNWRTESDDEASDDEDEDDLERLRQETEAIRQKQEEERLANEFGTLTTNGDTQDDDANLAGDDEAGETNGAAEAKTDT